MIFSKIGFSGTAFVETALFAKISLAKMTCGETVLSKITVGETAFGEAALTETDFGKLNHIFRVTIFGEFSGHHIYPAYI